MNKGEIAELATELYQELRGFRGDIDPDYALRKAREIVPDRISPESVVRKMEISYEENLRQRGYYS